MRFLTPSCLLSKHNVLLSRLWNSSIGVRVPSRSSSLAAIHRGLKNSKPSFKIKKGKKDIADKGPGAKSRKARFYDPDNDFGKKSLVYKMKSGQPSNASNSERMSPEQFLQDFNKSVPGSSSRSDDRGSRRTAPGNSGRGTKYDQIPRSSPPSRISRSSPSLQISQSSPSPPTRQPAKFAERLQRFAERPRRGESAGQPDQSRFPERPDRGRLSERPNQSRFSERSGQGKFSERPNRDQFAERSNQSRFSERSGQGKFSERPNRDQFAERPNQSRFSERSGQGRFSERPNRDQFAERSSQGRFSERSDRGGFSERSDRGKFSEGPSRGRFSEGPGRGQFADRPGRGRFSERPGQDRMESSDKPLFADKAKSREQQDTLKPSHTEGDITDGAHKSTRRDDGPIRIHHTTAASQFLYGRSVVEAAIKEARRKLYTLYIYNGEDRRNIPQDTALESLAQRKGVPVKKVEGGNLRLMDKMSDGRPHNGYVLEASPLPQLPLKALGPVSEEPGKSGFNLDIAYQTTEEAQVNGTSDFVGYRLPAGRNPFVLLLDGILDPGNLGAILRSAAFLGVNAVAITKYSSSTLTPVALKASAGASEVMTLFSVSSTVPFLTLSKEAGWMVYAAVPSRSSRSRGNSHLTLDRLESYDPLSTQPTILVMGSEGEGLSKPVRRQADFEVSIPSHSGFLSAVDSLNVSVATGILCSAFLKKQSSNTGGLEEEWEDEHEPGYEHEHEQWQEQEGEREQEQGAQEEGEESRLW